jgi:hypothetical protein
MLQMGVSRWLPDGDEVIAPVAFDMTEGELGVPLPFPLAVAAIASAAAFALALAWLGFGDSTTNGSATRDRDSRGKDSPQQLAPRTISL